MAFPTTRMRRLRASPALRGLVRETELRADRLVLPLFVSETAETREPIAGMPGVERLPGDDVLAEAREVAALGLGAVLLFGIPAEKDSEGSGAWDEQGAVQLAVAAIKRELPQLLV
ncbi:MAG TPA: porphobilinogen synthase, partial [Solirubrobacteraceae bacterium]|nr:porphobilinogen synthase [Solirubrobacteraceae bacterium]